jgi:hypothetical protein
VNFHLGGFSILNAVAGRDVTAEFDRYHDQGILNEDDYAALRIGRLVPERDSRLVGDHELVIRNLVFDITGKDQPLK